MLQIIERRLRLSDALQPGRIALQSEIIFFTALMSTEPRAGDKILNLFAPSFNLKYPLLASGIL